MGPDENQESLGKDKIEEVRRSLIKNVPYN